MNKNKSSSMHQQQQNETLTTFCLYPPPPGSFQTGQQQNCSPLKSILKKGQHLPFAQQRHSTLETYQFDGNSLPVTLFYSTTDGGQVQFYCPPEGTSLVEQSQATPTAATTTAATSSISMCNDQSQGNIELAHLPYFTLTEVHQFPSEAGTSASMSSSSPTGEHHHQQQHILLSSSLNPNLPPPSSS